MSQSRRHRQSKEILLSSRQIVVSFRGVRARARVCVAGGMAEEERTLNVLSISVSILRTTNRSLAPRRDALDPPAASSRDFFLSASSKTSLDPLVGTRSERNVVAHPNSGVGRDNFKTSCACNRGHSKAFTSGLPASCLVSVCDFYAMHILQKCTRVLNERGALCVMVQKWCACLPS